jgi:hypothetical protein
VSLCIAHWARRNEKPAVSSIGAPEARFDLNWLNRSKPQPKALEHLGQIFRMNRSLPTLALALFEAETCVCTPALIEEVDSPVRAGSPHKSRKRIDNLAEFVHTQSLS